MCSTPLYAKQDIASPQQTGKTYTIKGIVLDFNNEPIIGASVYIPGTNTGVATDLDGNFTLKVPANTKTVEFSYIGFEKKIIEFNPKNLNAFRVVTMKEDSGIALEDVTVVAFAKQKKNLY
ncbi:carboxypeptidase-like regulatory domain-containing protein [Bacteroides thetaiotaomicron]|nr:carboxypeptidase-like regulatory domain-containing protein [Bacteroides thetaiotaomicron]